MLNTGLLQEVPELYLDSCGSSTYHFLHKTVQEFMAALHVSTLPPGERANFVSSPFGKTKVSETLFCATMVVRFVAGLTKFQSQDEIGVLEFQKASWMGLCCERLLESLHWLFEAHDPALVQKCMGDKEWRFQFHRILHPLDCYVLGYCIANSRQSWQLNVSHCSINGECVKLLTMVENGRAFDYIKTLELLRNDKLGDEGAILLGQLY